ncbi:unnamed protein product, partial [marine sediment metagenome]
NILGNSGGRILTKINISEIISCHLMSVIFTKNEII